MVASGPARGCMSRRRLQFAFVNVVVEWWGSRLNCMRVRVIVSIWNISQTYVFMYQAFSIASVVACRLSHRMPVCKVNLSADAWKNEINESSNRASRRDNELIFWSLNCKPFGGPPTHPWTPDFQTTCYGIRLSLEHCCLYTLDLQTPSFCLGGWNRVPFYMESCAFFDKQAPNSSTWLWGAVLSSLNVFEHFQTCVSWSKMSVLLILCCYFNMFWNTWIQQCWSLMTKTA